MVGVVSSLYTLNSSYSSLTNKSSYVPTKEKLYRQLTLEINDTTINNLKYADVTVFLTGIQEDLYTLINNIVTVRKVYVYNKITEDNCGVYYYYFGFTINENNGNF